MKGKEWGIVIGVVVLIALVVSLLSVSITGNAIFGIGKKSASISSDDVVAKKAMDRLNKASIVGGSFPSGNHSCDTLCNQYGKVCVTAGTMRPFSNSSSLASLEIYTPGQCNFAFGFSENTHLALSCRCA